MFTEPIYAEYWLADLLQGDEPVLWTGHPDPKRILNTRDIIVIPFFLAVAIPITLILPDSYRIHLLSGLVWAAIILYVAIGRFYMRYREKQHTHYILTGKRVMILLRKGDSVIIKESIPFEAMIALTHSQKTDELGTLAFEQVMPSKHRLVQEKYDLGLQKEVFSSSTAAFFDITDSREVYDTINQIRYRNYRHILGDWTGTNPPPGPPKR